MRPRDLSFLLYGLNGKELQLYNIEELDNHLSLVNKAKRLKLVFNLMKNEDFTAVGIPC